MDGHSDTLLRDIALGIMFAAVAGHLVRAFRQPLILGYVLGGVVLGSHLGLGLVTDPASVELISEIGLILLLFIIGLEINLPDLVRMGRPMLVLGVVQFAVCVGLGLAVFGALGFGLGGGNFDRLYLAVGLALSSTLIVVKLLHDKFEVGTVSGRLTLGVLVLQDIWAILFMAFQPNLLRPEAAGVAKSLAMGAVLVGLAFLVSRYVLGRLFAAASRSPELVLLTSVAWCFAVGASAAEAGLSKEMGALIAGMSIAAFPYGADVIAKLSGVRDFFVTLFFVSLGLKVPSPTWGSVLAAAGVTAFVLASRLVSVAPTIYLAGKGLRNGLVAALNLSQISEFSLVILALGAGYGHVSDGLPPLVLSSMLLASILSTYLIQYNDALARGLARLARAAGVRERGDGAPADGPSATEARRDIVLLGCYRVGQAFLDVVEREAPELRSRVLVVDYNAGLREGLESRGFHWVYGDLAHPETLHHLGIEDAGHVVCSVSDTFLKGITNRRLLHHLKRLSPEAHLVMSAEDEAEAAALSREGAHDVLVAGRLSGRYLLEVVGGVPRHS
jgi:Kef-type K+ transport system membrane component KefB